MQTLFDFIFQHWQLALMFLAGTFLFFYFVRTLLKVAGILLILSAIILYMIQLRGGLVF